MITLEYPVCSPYNPRTSMVKPRVRRRESFHRRRYICLLPRENDLSYLRGSDIRISRSETRVFPRKIKEVRATLRPPSILKVPETTLGRRDWQRRCKGARHRDKIVVRGPQGRMDRIRIVLRTGSKEKIKSVSCVTMMIWNTCRVFDKLFQLIRNGKFECLSSTNISSWGVEPFDVMYIEISYIEDFSMWVRSLQGLMAGGKVMEEGTVVCRCIRTVTKAEDNCFGRKTNFKPEDVKNIRFKFRESCNRCIGVAVSSYSTSVTEV